LTKIIYVITLSLLSIGCSSTPNYLSSTEITKRDNQTKTLITEFEVMEIKPELESQSGIKYDISLIPKNVKIKKATITLGIKNKTVMARSLSGASAADLTYIIVPTNFHGSSTKSKKAPYSYATSSNIEYETSSLSLLERIGGSSGGKVKYHSKNEGIDEWDVTESLKYYVNNNKAFTFKFSQPSTWYFDSTIFSNSVAILKTSPKSLSEDGNSTFLTVYYN